MRNTFGRFAALAALVLLPGCQGLTGGNPTVAPATPHGLPKVSCSIAVSKPQFRIGEPVLISVTVQSLSDGPVNVAFWELTNQFPIVNFRIHGPGDSTLLVSTKQNLSCGTGIENRPLSAHQEHTASIDLLKTWEWGGVPTRLSPGKHRISAELFSTTPDGGSPKVTESGRTQFTVVTDK
jgi:hypothetical protein